MSSYTQNGTNMKNGCNRFGVKSFLLKDNVNTPKVPRKHIQYSKSNRTADTSSHQLVLQHDRIRNHIISSDEDDKRSKTAIPQPIDVTGVQSEVSPKRRGWESMDKTNDPWNNLRNRTQSLTDLQTCVVNNTDDQSTCIIDESPCSNILPKPEDSTDTSDSSDTTDTSDTSDTSDSEHEPIPLPRRRSVWALLHQRLVGEESVPNQHTDIICDNDMDPDGSNPVCEKLLPSLGSDYITSAIYKETQDDVPNSGYDNHHITSNFSHAKNGTGFGAIIQERSLSQEGINRFQDKRPESFQCERYSGDQSIVGSTEESHRRSRCSSWEDSQEETIKVGNTDSGRSNGLAFKYDNGRNSESERSSTHRNSLCDAGEQSSNLQSNNRDLCTLGIQDKQKPPETHESSVQENTTDLHTFAYTSSVFFSRKRGCYGSSESSGSIQAYYSTDEEQDTQYETKTTNPANITGTITEIVSVPSEKQERGRNDGTIGASTTSRERETDITGTSIHSRSEDLQVKAFKDGSSKGYQSCSLQTFTNNQERIVTYSSSEDETSSAYSTSNDESEEEPTDFTGRVRRSVTTSQSIQSLRSVTPLDSQGLQCFNSTESAGSTESAESKGTSVIERREEIDRFDQSTETFTKSIESQEPDESAESVRHIESVELLELVNIRTDPGCRQNSDDKECSSDTKWRIGREQYPERSEMVPETSQLTVGNNGSTIVPHTRRAEEHDQERLDRSNRVIQHDTMARCSDRSSISETTEGCTPRELDGIICRQSLVCHTGRTQETFEGCDKSESVGSKVTSTLPEPVDIQEYKPGYEPIQGRVDELRRVFSFASRGNSIDQPSSTKRSNISIIFPSEQRGSETKKQEESGRQTTGTRYELTRPSDLYSSIPFEGFSRGTEESVKVGNDSSTQRRNSPVNNNPTCYKLLASIKSGTATKHDAVSIDVTQNVHTEATPTFTSTCNETENQLYQPIPETRSRNQSIRGVDLRNDSIADTDRVDNHIPGSGRRQGILGDGHYQESRNDTRGENDQDEQTVSGNRTVNKNLKTKLNRESSSDTITGTPRESISRESGESREYSGYNRDSGRDEQRDRSICYRRYETPKRTEEYPYYNRPDTESPFYDSVSQCYSTDSKTNKVTSSDGLLQVEQSIEEDAVMEEKTTGREQRCGVQPTAMGESFPYPMATNEANNFNQGFDLSAGVFIGDLRIPCISCTFVDCICGPPKPKRGAFKETKKSRSRKTRRRKYSSSSGSSESTGSSNSSSSSRSNSTESSRASSKTHSVKSYSSSRSTITAKSRQTLGSLERSSKRSTNRGERGSVTDRTRTGNYCTRPETSGDTYSSKSPRRRDGNLGIRTDNRDDRVTRSGNSDRKSIDGSSSSRIHSRRSSLTANSGGMVDRYDTDTTRSVGGSRSDVNQGVTGTGIECNLTSKTIEENHHQQSVCETGETGESSNQKQEVSFRLLNSSIIQRNRESEDVNKSGTKRFSGLFAFKKNQSKSGAAGKDTNGANLSENTQDTGKKRRSGLFGFGRSEGISRKKKGSGTRSQQLGNQCNVTNDVSISKQTQYSIPDSRYNSTVGCVLPNQVDQDRSNHISSPSEQITGTRGVLQELHEERNRSRSPVSEHGRITGSKGQQKVTKNRNNQHQDCIRTESKLGSNGGGRRCGDTSEVTNKESQYRDTGDRDTGDNSDVYYGSSISVMCNRGNISPVGGTGSNHSIVTNTEATDYTEEVDIDSYFTISFDQPETKCITSTSTKQSAVVDTDNQRRRGTVNTNKPASKQVTGDENIHQPGLCVPNDALNYVKPTNTFSTHLNKPEDMSKRLSMLYRDSNLSVESELSQYSVTGVTGATGATSVTDVTDPSDTIRSHYRRHDRNNRRRTSIISYLSEQDCNTEPGVDDDIVYMNNSVKYTGEHKEMPIQADINATLPRSVSHVMPIIRNVNKKASSLSDSNNPVQSHSNHQTEKYVGSTDVTEMINSMVEKQYRVYNETYPKNPMVIFDPTKEPLLIYLKRMNMQLQERFPNIDVSDTELAEEDETLNAKSRVSTINRDKFDIDTHSLDTISVTSSTSGMGFERAHKTKTVKKSKLRKSLRSMFRSSTKSMVKHSEPEPVKKTHSLGVSLKVDKVGSIREPKATSSETITGQLTSVLCKLSKLLVYIPSYDVYVSLPNEICDKRESESTSIVLNDYENLFQDTFNIIDTIRIYLKQHIRSLKTQEIKTDKDLEKYNAYRNVREAYNNAVREHDRIKECLRVQHTSIKTTASLYTGDTGMSNTFEQLVDNRTSYTKELIAVNKLIDTIQDQLQHYESKKSIRKIRKILEHHEALEQIHLFMETMVHKYKATFVLLTK